MKIVKIDNFNTELIDDVLIAENVNKNYVDVIVNTLNDKYSGEQSSDYFISTKDDYELFERDY